MYSTVNGVWNLSSEQVTNNENKLYKFKIITYIFVSVCGKFVLFLLCLLFNREI